jgi:polysaccharide biosynthesis/export protein
MLRFSFLLLWVLAIGASCTVQRRIPNNYLENASDTTGKNETPIPDPVIQKNDLLSIQVYSASINPQIDAAYNLPVVSAGASGGPNGFLVNAAGEIEYPRLGTIRAEGLTKSQLADTLRGLLATQLTNPTVIIRFLNYRVTVLGEVRTPGTFTVPTERVTLLEALGLAGDINEFGLRSNVKVLRENNGVREIGLVDLTSKEMFRSPYYQLQQNDVVFVEQTRQRLRQRDQQGLLTSISIGTAILTSVALILNIFSRN